MEENLTISNYCASFIDLLGQQAALQGQNLMPILKTKEDEKKFLHTVKNSVGAIETLQKQVEIFRKSISTSSLSTPLSPNDKILYDEMKKVKAKQQRWSDGLVFYSSLTDTTEKCPMNAVFEIFLLSGTMCFIGLANKQPIRGAIEISWGVELHENELYGAVVANSYKLESKIAQYPRIVVGEQTINYLNAYLKKPENTPDKLFSYNRNLAQICLSMTAIDQDGYYIIDYLGKTFTESVTHSHSQELYKKAYSYIYEQYEIHKNNKNSKLALRYTWLKGYFHQHKVLHNFPTQTPTSSK